MKDPIQEQLIVARRNQILDAAAKVFAEKGFHPATIRDVAREASIADGTIYNYFKNKSALLLGILERMRESVMQTQISRQRSRWMFAVLCGSICTTP
ncbi:MAG: helix-turn-helix transcriptional regulator [Acaryochloridaceae cyanobacterium RU_4_10]|nr:helix-turn-helix transcriptional regulator [Acaryochloridaceae cyanobacterium RU_4_10]